MGRARLSRPSPQIRLPGVGGGRGGRRGSAAAPGAGGQQRGRKAGWEPSALYLGLATSTGTLWGEDTIPTERHVLGAERGAGCCTHVI